MRTDSSKTILRKNYTPPSYLVETVEIGFDLDPKATRVAMRLTMQRNPASTSRDIVLFGDGCKLLQLRMNGRELGLYEYQLDQKALRIIDAPASVTLEIETVISPYKNTSLMGLYMSNGNFFTQCEAEGFRKITFFPDRPDVMAKYTVMLRADKEKYPVLLSNGNLIEEGDLDDGRHYAKWEDPFKKPSYLFALVAAKLVCHEEQYTLKSGRVVTLQVWVEEGNLDKTQHAMESLKNSIRWDEERFGLELDLDRFMIVAVSDFNMGAMENKGLNLFNTQFILANPQIATDEDYANIESIIGHEYFHNWTGNRVTCRDWFQLSLKEGLTVFRDQEFTGDMIGTESGRAVSRIEKVRTLRQTQFPEDAGALAHPVRPDSYAEINNFYTSTVYYKGAEVVRMLQTLVGREGFRKGMDLYFKRHDGQAVQCDDFRAAIADANGRDLSLFERWYNQAGTPRVAVTTNYNASARTFEITLSQSCPKSPLQSKKLPFHIPIAIGLLDSKGQDIPLSMDDASQGKRRTGLYKPTVVLEMTKGRQIFRFTQIPEAPTPSLLRNFSAPIIIDYDYTDDQLLHLYRHDSDAFNRWEAGQRLAMRRLVKLIAAVQSGARLELDNLFIEAQRAVLNDTSLDPAFRKAALTLPSESAIAEQLEVADPQAIHAARQFMRLKLAQGLKVSLLSAYEGNLTPGPYSPRPEAAGRRALKNLALSYLLELPENQALHLAQAQFEKAGNMTDRSAALVAMLNIGEENRSGRKAAAKALQGFYKMFENEVLVIDKWFTYQAASHNTDVAAVRELMRHPAFTLNNPNRARSVILAFCGNNQFQFHALDGSGYAFWAEQVLALDAINPQLAGRVARSIERWRNFLPELQAKIEPILRQVADTKNLSGDVLEVITKALAD